MVTNNTDKLCCVHIHLWLVWWGCMGPTGQHTANAFCSLSCDLHVRCWSFQWPMRTEHMQFNCVVWLIDVKESWIVCFAVLSCAVCLHFVAKLLDYKMCLLCRLRIDKINSINSMFQNVQLCSATIVAGLPVTIRRIISVCRHLIFCVWKYRMSESRHRN